MTREAEVVNDIEELRKSINEAKKLDLTREDVRNINLSTIAQQLSNISVTLAIIADKLDKEESE